MQRLWTRTAEEEEEAISGQKEAFSLMCSSSHRVRRLLWRRLGPLPPPVGQQQQDDQPERHEQNPQPVSEDGLRREAAVRRAPVSASFPVEKVILAHRRTTGDCTFPPFNP